MVKKVNLSLYNNSWYHSGPKWKRFVWFFVNALFFLNPLNPISRIKVWLLRLFGAKISQGVVIKPGVNIKYPWNLEIGSYCWIGEKVWIDSLKKVTIGENVCISQGAMLLCGNHNYKKTSFDLMLGEITIEEGVWIGAQSVVCPGVICKSHSVLTIGSVATSIMETYSIYQGNPAIIIKKRLIQ